MRTIERSGRFRRDYKRELRGAHGSILAAVTASVVQDLALDVPLALRFKDHALSGGMAGLRDCHVRPDLVLIYAKPDADTLRLLRLGSHNEIFS